MNGRDTVAERCFDDRAGLARELATDIARWLNTGLATRPRASLVVSGGGTPVPLFRSLRSMPVAWRHVDVTLADERWVPSVHPDSNEGLLHRELLRDAAGDASFFPLKGAAETPEAAVAAGEETLRRMHRPFDVVVLGMGRDGHTASLFPGSEALAVGLDPDTVACCVACQPMDAPHPRLSLGLAVLLQTRRLVLHITGTDKRQTYRQALTADPGAMPVAAVLKQTRVPVTVYWAP